MKISIVVARDLNNVVGYKNSLPWGRIPRDMKHFKDLTIKGCVVMGRETLVSMGGPLSDRTNIILTRDPDFSWGCEDGICSPIVVATSIEDALSTATAVGFENIFVIGGASIYKQFIDIADTIYLTLIYGAFLGDAYFDFDERNWEEIERERYDANDKNKYTIEFITYERKD